MDGCCTLAFALDQDPGPNVVSKCHGIHLSLPPLARNFFRVERILGVSGSLLDQRVAHSYGSSLHLILVAKSKAPSQAACSMTRLKAEVRVCSGASPRSQLIN